MINSTITKDTSENQGLPYPKLMYDNELIILATGEVCELEKTTIEGTVIATGEDSPFKIGEACSIRRMNHLKTLKEK